MAKNALLDLVADSRRKTIIHEEDGKQYVESRQDVEPIMEWVSKRRDRPQDPDYHLLGVIPEAVLNQAMIEGWFHDAKAWRNWLNENSKFRISEKRI